MILSHASHTVSHGGHEQKNQHLLLYKPFSNTQGTGQKAMKLPSSFSGFISFVWLCWCYFRVESDLKAGSSSTKRVHISALRGWRGEVTVWLQHRSTEPSLFKKHISGTQYQVTEECAAVLPILHLRRIHGWDDWCLNTVKGSCNVFLNLWNHLVNVLFERCCGVVVI